MQDNTAVDRLYEEAAAVILALQQTPEISLQVAAADHLRKALLLAAASYFEHRVCGCVLEFIRECAGGSALVENFVRNKAIARQYHTWFKWDENNANQFFSLFGSEFRATMSNRVKGSDDLQSSVRAFLEVGNERNRLVHQDYATFPMDKTLDEIYALYRSALAFIEHLPKALRECDKAWGRQPPSNQAIINVPSDQHSDAQPGAPRDAP
jgi:RiboL-PSP-HEPN